MHAWNQEFVANSLEGKRYEVIADEIERALHFMKACGIDLHDDGALQGVDFYTSHEALILPYEQALTRRDSLTGDWYDCSAHMLWIGDRTRQLDGAHVEFLRGVSNPIGLKVGPTLGAERTRCDLVDTLNPDNVPGRLTLISRMGRDRISELLPAARASAARRGPQRGVGLRPHARQHLRRLGRPEDPPLRRRAVARPRSSSPCTSRSAPGRAACTSS